MNANNLTVDVAITVDARTVPVWRVHALIWFARLLCVPVKVACPGRRIRRAEGVVTAAVRAWNWVRCRLLGDHDWTCKAEQGVKPSADELCDGLAGFDRYAQLFCSRCGRQGGRA